MLVHPLLLLAKSGNGVDSGVWPYVVYNLNPSDHVIQTLGRGLASFVASHPHGLVITFLLAPLVQCVSLCSKQ